MKSIIKKSAVFMICVIVALSSVVSAFADTEYSSGGLLYNRITATTIRLSGADSSIEDLSVPKSIDDYYVTEIKEDAFNGNTNLKSLDFSKASMLNQISSRAFQDCSEITGDIVLSGKINSLGYSTFQGCSSIQSLKIYAPYLKIIPDQSFYNCSSLSSVLISTNIQRIDKLAFANCASLESVIIPDSVTSIDASAFLNDANVTILCNEDSYAQQFAVDNNVDYDIINPLYGDVDGNGKINIRDVTYIQLYGVGRYEMDKHALKRANVNRDDKVNIRDATYIQLYKVGKITSFDNLT